MKIKNGFVAFLLATPLALVALPSAAGNAKKMYSLDMEIVSAPPAQTTPPFTLSATLTNSPNGNSTINSFHLAVAGLTIVGVDQPATGAATFTASSVSIQHMHPLKPGQSLTVTIYVSSCGDGSWGADVWTGSGLSGQMFNLVSGASNLSTPIPCGDLASGADFTVPDSINPACVTGHRGFYDKNGVIPEGALPYFVTNTLPTNDQLHFRWPDFEAGGDPAATFEYTICAPGDVPPAGATGVSWLNADGSPASEPGTPAFIEAQACLDPDILPEPYGALTSDVAEGDTAIMVNTAPSGVDGLISPAAPPFDIPTPFDIVIGTERMTVTDVVCVDTNNDDGETADPMECNETALSDAGEGFLQIWTVTRGVGHTDIASHATGGLAMSTPLPLLPEEGVVLPYLPGRQAQMCIANQGPVEGGGHFTTLIDIGDGHVLLP